MVSQPKAVTPVDLSSLDYPELPEERTSSPPEPQLPPAPESVTRNGHLQYPILPSVAPENVHGSFVKPNGSNDQANVNTPNALAQFQPNTTISGLQLGEQASTVAPTKEPIPLHKLGPGPTFDQPAAHPPVPQSQTGVPFPRPSDIKPSVPSNAPSSRPGVPLSQFSTPTIGASDPHFSVESVPQTIVPNPAGPPAPNTTMPHIPHQPVFQPTVPSSGPPSVPATPSSSLPSAVVSQPFPATTVPFSSPSSQPVVSSSLPPRSQFTSPSHIPSSGPDGSRHTLPNAGPAVSPVPGSQPVSINSTSSTVNQAPSVSPVPATSATVLPSPSTTVPQLSTQQPGHSQSSGVLGSSVPGQMPHQVPQSTKSGQKPQDPSLSQVPPGGRQVPGQSSLSANQPHQTASTPIPRAEPRNNQHGGQTSSSTSQTPPYNTVSGGAQHSPQKPTQMPGNSQASTRDSGNQPGRESSHQVDQSSPKTSQQLLSNKKNSYVTTPGLPPGWERIDNGGRPYYKDHNTQTTHWDPLKEQTSGSKVGAPQATVKKQQQPQIKRQSSVDKPTLHRSLSSPNIAKLLDQESSGPKRPVIDRLSKPDSEQAEPARPMVNRGAKPLSANQLDGFNPSYGGIGAALTGLRNLGNTCYMNSVIQCLSSVAPLAAFLISGAYRDDINRTSRDGTRGRCLRV